MTHAADAIERLLAIMNALRDPFHGCPWDLRQDFASIAPHTLEEVYEVIDAIEQGDPGQIEAELGDLLFQVVFLARLGSERGLFDFASIAQGIALKLLQRHPHVFPDGTFESAGRPPAIEADEVSRTWEQIKQEERKRRQPGEVSLLDDVPLALPALLRAAKLQKRAALAGFDWSSAAGVLAKVREEQAELEEAIAVDAAEQVREEFGDLLFTMVNLGRHLGLNPESALRAANHKFEARFRAVEHLAAAEGLVLQELDAAALDVLWQRAKTGSG